MEKKEILERIINCGIAAVVRGKATKEVLLAVEAAIAGGIDIIEITFTVPAALEIIRELAVRLKDKAVVGAGTVLSPERAESAIKAGAEFIVSPNMDLEVIGITRGYNKPCMPGAFTPSEVYLAWKAGADMVKIFPASILGPDYIKALRGPFPDLSFMPTGGINLANAAGYLRAGAVCLGVGGELINKKAMEDGRYDIITENAGKFVRIVRENR